MNQPYIIRSLDLLMKRDYAKALRIIEMTNKGFITSQGLLDKGIYSCFNCGHLNSIDGHDCNGCGEEKFIYMDKDWKVQKRKTNL